MINTNFRAEFGLRLSADRCEHLEQLRKTTDLRRRGHDWHAAAQHLVEQSRVAALDDHDERADIDFAATGHHRGLNRIYALVDHQLSAGVAAQGRDSATVAEAGMAPTLAIAIAELRRRSLKPPR